MLLPDHEIYAEIESGHVQVEPFTFDLIQPASIDVRLHNRLLVLDRIPTQPWASPVLDPAEDSTDLFRRVELRDGETMLIAPGACVLASTLERFRFPADLAGRFEGKSSIGRMFQATHVTAGFIDPGFEGHITLELVNHAPVPFRLHPGMRIGQVSFTRMSARASAPYGHHRNGSHYQGQEWPTPSRSHERFTATHPVRMTQP